MGLSLLIVILVALIGYNAIPIFNRFLPWTAEYTFLSDLFIVNPLVAFLCGLIIGWSYGFIIWVPVLIGALFIPTVFIFYNSSALIYVVAYGVISLVGMIIGSVVNNRRTTRTNIEKSIRRHGYYD